VIEGRALDLRKFLFSFQGRIGRADFWSLLLAVVALLITLAVVANFIPIAFVQVPATIALGALAFVVWLSATVRRLHDRDKSAWYLLLFFGVPSLLQSFRSRDGSVTLSFFSGGTNSFLDLICLAISIWMIVELGGLPGTAGPNRYGPIPSESAA
jgi:uncharacterized membrane protein YhaH (DUF805 family)